MASMAEIEAKKLENDKLLKPSKAKKEELAGLKEGIKKLRLKKIAKEHIENLKAIREMEIAFAQENGRQVPEPYSENELNLKLKEAVSTLSQNLRTTETRITESTLESRLKEGKQLQVLDSYLKRIVPTSRGFKLSRAELFSKDYSGDGIEVTNYAPIPTGLDNVVQAKIIESELINEDETFKIFASNFQELREAVARRQQETGTEILEGKYKIDVAKFFGAIDLSDAKSREIVYDYWEEIDGLYEPFISALDNFISVAKDSKNEDFVKRVEVFEKSFGGSSPELRYTANIPKVKVEMVDPIEKFLNVILNAMYAENITDEVDTIMSETALDDEPQFQNDLERLEAEMFGNTSGDGFDTSIDLESSKIIDDVNADIEGQDERVMRRIIDSDLDILLAIESYRNNKLVSATEEIKAELTSVLRDLDDVLTEKEKIKFGFNVDFQRWRSQIKQSLTLERDNYFIPVNVGKDFSIVPDKGDYNLRLEKISEFFEALEVMLKDYESQSMFEVRQRRGKDATTIEPSDDPRRGDPKSISSLFSARSPIISGKRTELPEYLDKLREPLKELLQAMVNYYVEPITSGKLPYSIPDYVRKLGYKDSLLLAYKLGLETTTGEELVRATSIGVESLDPEDLNELAQFLGSIFTSNVRVDGALLRLAGESVDALTALFGNRQANREYISAVLYDVMQETNDDSLANRKLSRRGKTIAEEAKEFENNRKSTRKGYPIFGLPLYLDVNEGVFVNAKPELRRAYDKLVSVVKDIGNDLNIMLKMLLRAHDEIRKALGKEVVYGFNPLTYEAISKFIDEQNYDLTSFELENIVKSEDSHKGLGNEYGIGTEDVYLIKANFR